MYRALLKYLSLSILQLLHALDQNSPKSTFENVRIYNWRISLHENDGSTDFSDDENLDDHHVPYPYQINNNNNNNVLRTPERTNGTFPIF